MKDQLQFSMQICVEVDFKQFVQLSRRIAKSLHIVSVRVSLSTSVPMAVIYSFTNNNNLGDVALMRSVSQSHG